MVGMRELAEAQAYERRRKVRAFVAGDPAPPRGDGPSAWRSLLGGALLAIVLIVGVVMIPSALHP
ncbi:hypothetical protein GCM10011584_26660 [Nocardioides phosphati]|uniref:Uncharacterized protein n=1 Tax=Nocardioides phosphati TaxID=1867775 RepID=A0ABQ2NCY5_9ACTN|nr:hypothetical protein [Nocardioides phosphati]GGO91776.1 hypothetical protein GCM10011584_26660 [Nocardioides phosphati]